MAVERVKNELGQRRELCDSLFGPSRSGVEQESERSQTNVGAESDKSQ